MNSIPQQLLLQLFLILLNAFFAMTEIAVISLSPAKLRKLSEEGDKTAPRLLKLVEEPAGFLSTIQIGITLAGFLGSAFAADNFSEIMVNWIYYDLGFQGISLRILDTLSVIIITVILSYFTLVLGELTPNVRRQDSHLQGMRQRICVYSRRAGVLCCQDLGCESVKRLTVRGFPLIVAADCAGQNLFDAGRAAYRKEA